MIRTILCEPELITDMSEPVNSITMKVLQPLWNQSSPRTNNCLAYSNYSYSGIGPPKRAFIAFKNLKYVHYCLHSNFLINAL